MNADAKPSRDQWLGMSDDELMRLCRCDTCRGTGPGGQKRNKTESAVRLTHEASGMSVTDDHSRSQHLNRHAALRKLRLEIALQIRVEPQALDKAAYQLVPGVNNALFPMWAAHVMDVLEAMNYHLAEAAAAMGLSTGRLGKELAQSPTLWQRVNQERAKRKLSTLRQ